MSGWMPWLMRPMGWPAVVIFSCGLMAWGGCDEPVDVPVDTFGVGYSGAQSGGWADVDEGSSIRCRFDEGAFVLDLSRSPEIDTASVTIRIDPCDRQVDKVLDASDFSRHDLASLALPGGYDYFLGLDYSRQSLDECWSHCEGVVFLGDAAPWGRVSGHIQCLDLTAKLTSSDYEEDPVDFEPRVDLVVRFDCALEVL